MEDTTSSQSMAFTKEIPRESIAGILPYTESISGRKYHFHLIDGILISDFQPSRWKRELNPSCRRRINGRASFVGRETQMAVEIVVPVEMDELPNLDIITLDTTELMGIISGSPCQRVASLAVDMRLMSLLKSGAHIF